MNYLSKISILAGTTVSSLLAGCALQPVADDAIDDANATEDEDVGEVSSNLVSGALHVVKPGHTFGLNLHYNTHANGAVVNLWTLTGHESQTWSFGDDGRIHPSNDASFCLAHWGDADDPGNGSAAVLWSCVDHDSQRWSVWPDGTIRKQSNPNKCLNLDSNAYENGHVVDVYDCNGHESQQWASSSAVSVVHPPGSEVSGEVGAFLSTRGADKPALSIPRGAGTIPDSCPDGYEKDGALCYPECGSGYDGVGPICWESCPPGWSDFLTTCAAGSGAPANPSYDCWSTGSFPYFSCGYSCPTDYTYIGVTCVANSFPKDTYGRGAGSPLSCSSNLEEDSGLCYEKCPVGYDGVGPVCWLDGSDLSDLFTCEGVYSPALASNAQAIGKTMTYGLGGGVVIGAAASIEGGSAYGPQGEFGCYKTACWGIVFGASIGPWGAFGQYDMSFDRLAGDSTMTVQGVGAGYLGATVGFVSDSNGNSVGISESLSVGPNSPIPIQDGSVACHTWVNQLW